MPRKLLRLNEASRKVEVAVPAVGPPLFAFRSMTGIVHGVLQLKEIDQ